MDENSTPSLAKNKFLVGGVIIFVLIVLTGFIYVLSLNKKKQVSFNKTPPNENSNKPVSIPKNATLDSVNKADFTSPITYQLPSVSFDTYSSIQQPTVEKEYAVFNLQSSFSEEDGKKLAQKIGFEGAINENSKDRLILTKNKDIFIFNKNTGHYSVFMNNGLKNSSLKNNSSTEAMSFFKNNIMTDETLSVTDTYKRKSTPGVIFVEIHRDWNKLGLPLLSKIGVLNLRENERVSNIRLGQIDTTSPVDNDIYYAQNSLAGYARPQDFNTIVLSVDENNKNIIGIYSNIRPIIKKQTAQNDSLKSPEDAIAELRLNQSNFALTMPLGEGSLDPSRVYPNIDAHGKDATLTDFNISYIENPEGLTARYEPYYIFRGTSTLDSGYRVQFVKLISAMKNSTNNVLGASTQRYLAQGGTPSYTGDTGGTIQYSSDVPYLTGAPTPILVNPTPFTQYPCANFNHQFKIEGGTLAWFEKYTGQAFDRDGQPYSKYVRLWYFLPDPENLTISEAKWNSIMEWKNETNVNSIGEAARKCEALTNQCAVTDANDRSKYPYCYYFTHGSPSLYFYSSKKESVSVRIAPLGGVKYADPIFSDSSKNIWNVTTNSDASVNLDSGIRTSRLYYEYNKENFISILNNQKMATKSILKSQIKEFILKDLAYKINLNVTESNDLFIEIARETKDIKSEFIDISMISKKQLDSYLPVYISKAPDNFYRINLYIKPSGNIKKNDILPYEKIKRSGFTVVETGVLVDSN